MRLPSAWTGDLRAGCGLAARSGCATSRCRPRRGCRGCTHTCSDIRRTAGHITPPSATTMLDAGVDLRDVQIAARHADPRTTTMR